MLKMACMDLSSQTHEAVSVPICLWTNSIGEHALRAKVLISAERLWTFHFRKVVLDSRYMDKWHQAASVGVKGLFGNGNFNNMRHTGPPVFHLTGNLTIYTPHLIHKHSRSQTNAWKICGKSYLTSAKAISKLHELSRNICAKCWYSFGH